MNLRTDQDIVQHRSTVQVPFFLQTTMANATETVVLFAAILLIGKSFF